MKTTTTGISPPAFIGNHLRMATPSLANTTSAGGSDFLV
jgi:hypothetical protein